MNIKYPDIVEQVIRCKMQAACLLTYDDLQVGVWSFHQVCPLNPAESKCYYLGFSADPETDRWSPGATSRKRT